MKDEKTAPTFESKRMYKNGVEYSITVSPSDDLQFYGKNATDRYRSFVRASISLLQKLSEGGCRYQLYPEIGKKTYRLHYHGKIVFTDVATCMLSILPDITKAHTKKPIMNIDIDTIDDSRVWEEYITKDKEIMLPFAKTTGYPYSITHLHFTATGDVIKRKLPSNSMLGSEEPTRVG